MRTQIKTISLKTYLCGALLLGAGLMPATALAQDAASATTPSAAAEAEPAVTSDGADATVAAGVDSASEAPDDDKIWSLTASLSTRIYQGMFVGLENPDAELSSPNAASTSHAFSRWSNIYTVGAGLKLGDFNLLANLGASHWMSRGGGLNEPYEFRLQDLTVTAAWNGYNIDAIDTRIALDYTLVAPTSTVSRTANMIVGNYLGLTLSKTILGKLSLAYNLGGAWIPASEGTGSVDADTAQIYREDELVGNDVSIPGNIPVEFALSHTFAASFPIVERLSVSATYTYGNAWTREVGTPDDGFTAPAEGVQTGRNYGDGTTATAGLTYSINDYIKLAGGVRTSQRPKTDDNRSFNFPWWNFSGAATNRSALYLTLAGTY